MKMIDVALPTSVSGNDVLCSTHQDHDSYNQESHHDAPEEAHEDKSTAIAQDAYQYEVTVEGHPSFLDLSVSASAIKGSLERNRKQQAY